MNASQADLRERRSIGWPALTAILLLAITLSVIATLWVASTWLFPRPFSPVVLDGAERVVLETKLQSLAGTAPPPASRAEDPPPERAREIDAGPLQAAPYVERPEDRIVYFTQRELNAMIGRNPDLAGRLALHLSEDVLSATMLITLPSDLPVLAGQTVRVATGLRLRHDRGRPVVSVEGVSIMGVPLPDAWLGGIKGRDLVALHGAEGGFWRAFGEGVRDLRIEEGRLRVELAE